MTVKHSEPIIELQQGTSPRITAVEFALLVLKSVRVMWRVFKVTRPRVGDKISYSIEFTFQ